MSRQVLPLVAKPVSYKLEINPDPVSLEFNGTVEIALDILKSTKELYLNINEVQVDNVSVITDGQSIKATKSTVDDKLEMVTFEFTKEIVPGSNTVLRCGFKGTHNDKMAGFYRSGYKDENGTKKFMVVTQFEATDARRCFPCFDEPNLKATFQVTINVDHGLTALSNMPVIDEKEVTVNEKTKKQYVFDNTPIMSTYLLAMAVGEFDYIQSKAVPKSPKGAKPIDVRVFTLKGQSAQGQFGLDVAVKTLEFFSSYFDIAYPLPKMDLIAIPDFAAGAMENWGLVTYREIYLLYDEKTTSSSVKQRIAYVVGHELAHQWFGNLVTMDWWSELWLNEGFATFVGWMAVDNLFPEWKVWTQFVTNDYSHGLALDCLRSSHPIEVEVQSPSEINQIFDAISYSKGASVIRMLNSFLGQETFMNGVRLYLKKHAYSNATTLDLWSSLKEASGVDVATLMFSWTRKMGYPMVTVVSEQYDSSQKSMTLTLRQQRYLKSGDLSAAEENESPIWWIPIGVVTHMSPKKPLSLILTEKEGTITFVSYFAFKLKPYDDSSNESYYKMNYGSTGFYRINLNQKQLQKLGNVISKNLAEFETTDKIGVLADSFALAVAGYGSTAGALEIIKAYEKEIEYNVLEEVEHALDIILSSFYLENRDISDGILELQRRIFSSKVRELGYDYSAKEDHLKSLKRTLAIRSAANAGDLEVLAELTKRFKIFLNGDNSALHTNILGTACKAVLKNSSDPFTDFDTILNFYKSTTSVDQKLSALASLGSVQNTELVHRLFELVLDSDVVKPQDIIYPLGPIGQVSALKGQKLDMLWNWIIQNWIELHKRYKASLSLLGRVLQSAIGPRIGLEFIETVESWARGDDLGTAEEKAARQDQLKTARRPLDQSIESVKTYTKWVSRDRDTITQWIKSNLSK